MIELKVYGSEEVAADVRRCLMVLFSTRVGTVAMDRAFGLTQDWLDLPAPLARAKISTELLEKIARYEPRVTVKKLGFTGAADGTLKPTVEVQING